MRSLPRRSLAKAGSTGGARYAPGVIVPPDNYRNRSGGAGVASSVASSVRSGAGVGFGVGLGVVRFVSFFFFDFLVAPSLLHHDAALKECCRFAAASGSPPGLSICDFEAQPAPPRAKQTITKTANKR